MLAPKREGEGEGKGEGKGEGEGGGGIVVESRGPRGETRKSHWQTVLPLLADRPRAVAAGDSLTVEASVTLGRAVAEPPRYALRAELAH